MATFVTARPVVWADGVSVNANDLRAGRAALLTPGATSLAARGGVLPGPGDPGLISALGTPAMKVHVKAGPYEVPSSSATGGSYTVVVDADADLDITASDASNPRTDLVIAEVVDNGDATTTYKVRMLDGTAAPGAPRPTNTTPNAHWITIGSVDVRALAESSGYIRAQDVHPERLFAVARGGILPVADATERDALTGYEGMYVDRADTDQLERFDGTSWEVRGPKQPTRGSFSGDISGSAPVIVAHGLGAIPSQVLISKKKSAFSHLFNIERDTTDSANFVVSAYRYDGTALTVTPVAFDWVAYL